MTTGPISLCASCSRLTVRDDGVACSAFPEGIPDRIWIAGFDHRKAYEGDRGIRYEMELGADGLLAAYETSLELPESSSSARG